MLDQLMCTPIGRIEVAGDRFTLALTRAFSPALQGLEGFSHIVVVWWFSEFDDSRSRAIRVVERPYRRSPETVGVFATRSLRSPNPLAISTAQVLDIDHLAARIDVAYIEAFDQTPILDIKPYSPCLDRVECPTVPSWCAHWPHSLEESEEFDWEAEFQLGDGD